MSKISNFNLIKFKATIRHHLHLHQWKMALIQAVRMQAARWKLFKIKVHYQMKYTQKSANLIKNKNRIIALKRFQ